VNEIVLRCDGPRPRPHRSGCGALLATLVALSLSGCGTLPNPEAKPNAKTSGNQALELLDVALALTGTDDALRATIAHMYMRLGQLETGLTVARAMPDGASAAGALTAIARSLHYRSKKAEALELLPEIAQLAKGAGPATRRMAVTIHATVGEAAVLEPLLKLPEYTPHAAAGRRVLLQAAASRGDVKTATALLATMPESLRPGLQLSMAEAVATTGNRVGALKWLREAMASGRLGAVELLRTAALARRLKEPALGAAAVEEYATRVAKQQQRSAYGMVDLGIEAHRLGMPGLGRKIVDKALAEVRGARLALRAARLPYLAYALSELGDEEGARAALAEAVQSAGAGEPKRQEVLLRVAKMYAGMGLEHEARQLIAPYPSTAVGDVLLHIADHFLSKGDAIAATEVLVELERSSVELTNPAARSTRQRLVAERFYRANDNASAVDLLNASLASIKALGPAERARPLVDLVRTMFQTRLSPNRIPELTGR